jgi:hypothetical protein
VKDFSPYLVTAVAEKRIFEFRDEWQHTRTLELHLYGIAWGNREVVIGYQIDAGRGIANEELWKMLPASKIDLVEPARHFSAKREIPKQYIELMRKIHARA